MSDDCNFCVQCKFLLGIRYQPENIEKWRCFNEANLQGEVTNYVTGEKIATYKQQDIMIVRMNTCQGEWFQEYIPPVYQPTASKPLEVPSFGDAALSLDDLAANREAAEKRIREIREKKSTKQRPLSANDLENL